MKQRSLVTRESNIITKYDELPVISGGESSSAARMLKSPAPHSDRQNNLIILSVDK